MSRDSKNNISIHIKTRYTKIKIALKDKTLRTILTREETHMRLSISSSSSSNKMNMRS